MKSPRRGSRTPFPAVTTTPGTEVLDLRGWSALLVDCILRLEGSPVVRETAPREETA
jgi:hypothetical protein